MRFGVGYDVLDERRRAGGLIRKAVSYRASRALASDWDELLEDRGECQSADPGHDSTDTIDTDNETGKKHEYVLRSTFIQAQKPGFKGSSKRWEDVLTAGLSKIECRIP